jgi:hypothetical protein
MNRFRKLRPTPSMVIACTALLVALAGTSVAAVSIVIPRNSVGAAQLKPNSVNSLKVLNGSLLRADFRAGQIPAGRQGPPGPPGPAGPAGPTRPAGATSTTSSIGHDVETNTVSSTDQFDTASTSFTNLNNGSLTVNVPTGETDKIVVWFNAESACYAGSSLQKCLVKINVDGTELTPAAGLDGFFDNNDLGVGSPNHNTDDTFRPKSSGDASYHSIIRYSGNLSAGSHVVQVQVATTNASTHLLLDDWTLVSQRIRVS